VVLFSWDESLEPTHHEISGAWAEILLFFKHFGQSRYDPSLHYKVVFQIIVHYAHIINPFQPGCMYLIKHELVHFFRRTLYVDISCYILQENHSNSSTLKYPVQVFYVFVIRHTSAMEQVIWGTGIGF